MAIAINGDSVGFAIPCADRRLEIPHQIISFNLIFYPIGHFIKKAFASCVTFEWCAHFDNIKINRSGCNRLLQSGVIIGLRQIDPIDFCAGIGFPRF